MTIPSVNRRDALKLAGGAAVAAVVSGCRQGSDAVPDAGAVPDPAGPLAGPIDYASVRSVSVIARRGVGHPPTLLPAAST